MAYVSRLYNPTPWDEAIDWGNRGQSIRVPAFGHADINHEQMHDFRDNNPGAEGVLNYIEYFGIFLFDADRPYDNQALDALRKAQKARKQHYDQAVKNLLDRRSQQGIAPNPEAFEEHLRLLGLTNLREKVETLQALVKKLEESVGPDRSARPKLDPARTLFITDPPREFPSVAAMEFFLERNPEVAAKHAAFLARTKAEVSTNG